MEEARLVKIKEVLKELPPPHYRYWGVRRDPGRDVSPARSCRCPQRVPLHPARTLEFLMRHLLLMASYSGRTNMHARNLAIVWAPNLLR